MLRYSVMSDPEEHLIFFEELHFDVTTSSDGLTQSVKCTSPEELSYEQFIYCLETWINDVKAGRAPIINSSEEIKH